LTDPSCMTYESFICKILSQPHYNFLDFKESIKQFHVNY
jgi:hypothetical protein